MADTIEDLLVKNDALTNEMRLMEREHEEVGAIIKQYLFLQVFKFFIRETSHSLLKAIILNIFRQRKNYSTETKYLQTESKTWKKETRNCLNAVVR